MLNVIETGDRQQVRTHIALFKERGVVNFEAVLAVPSTERIQHLALQPKGRERVSAALAASIKSAFESLNLRVGMNIEQILDLSDEIIDQSAEDNLALEDVLLFLQQLITGKTGKIYDRMDIPTFFEMFEVYRQDRHDALLATREQEQVNHKAFGDPDRSSDNNTEEVAMKDAMIDYLRKSNIKE